MIELRLRHWTMAAGLAIGLNGTVLFLLLHLSGPALKPTPPSFQLPVPLTGAAPAVPPSSARAPEPPSENLLSLPDPPPLLSELKLPARIAEPPKVRPQDLQIDAVELMQTSLDILPLPVEISGPALRIFGADEVDQIPQALFQPSPEYPLRARRQNVTGLVTVEMVIGVDGRVQTLEIVEADPPGYFEESVRQTLSRWQFRPGVLNGKPVPTRVRQPVPFTLAGENNRHSSGGGP